MGFVSEELQVPLEYVTFAEPVTWLGVGLGGAFGGDGGPVVQLPLVTNEILAVTFARPQSRSTQG